MTFDEYKAAGMSDDDAATAAAADAAAPPSVVEAKEHEAAGIDPAADPAPEGPSLRQHDELKERILSLEYSLHEYGVALTLILKHLDPAGTSHAFDELREG